MYISSSGMLSRVHSCPALGFYFCPADMRWLSDWLDSIVPFIDFRQNCIMMIYSPVSETLVLLSLSIVTVLDYITVIYRFDIFCYILCHTVHCFCSVFDNLLHSVLLYCCNKAYIIFLP